MRLDFRGDRALAVTAHPDDAELLCAGTLARAKADGAPVAIAVLCRGDGGVPPGRARDPAALRRREAAAAARLLGARLYMLGAPDGALADTPAVRRRLIDVYREFRPTLVLAHAPTDYHPDHRAAAALAEAASWLCASHGQRMRRPALPCPPALWWMDTVGMAGFEPGFYVDVSAALPLKERMLACHRSQLERGADRDFAPLADLMRRQAASRGAQAGVAAAEAFRTYTAFKRARAW